jgi:hypothetical protein
MRFPQFTANYGNFIKNHKASERPSSAWSLVRENVQGETVCQPTANGLEIEPGPGRCEQSVSAGKIANRHH